MSIFSLQALASRLSVNTFFDCRLPAPTPHTMPGEIPRLFGFPVVKAPRPNPFVMFGHDIADEVDRHIRVSLEKDREVTIEINGVVSNWDELTVEASPSTPMPHPDSPASSPTSNTATPANIQAARTYANDCLTDERNATDRALRAAKVQAAQDARRIRELEIALDTVGRLTPDIGIQQTIKLALGSKS